MAELESLSLFEYLNKSTHSKRILVVPEVSKGNTLIRLYEKKTAKIVQNVSCQTIGWLADQIYNYVQAGKGYDTGHDLIDDQSALMVFRSTLINNIGSLKYYRDKEKLMSIVTTRELFDKVNLMRGNECCLDSISGDESGRISDLKALIEKYEQDLEAQKAHDRTARFKYILDYLRKGGVFRNVFGANTQISYLKEESDLYNSIQNELLERISSQEVSYFANEVSEEDVLKQLAGMDKEKNNIKFFKGLGTFNEANYIAYDILDGKKNYGDVLVLYNSAGQLPAIRSALSGNGITTCVISSYPATENCIISLTRSIIAWAMDDYSEKSLETVLGSPVCYVPGLMAVKNVKEQEADVSEDNVDDSELSEEEKEKIKKRNLLSGGNYFNYVTKARRLEKAFTLGWGFQRNKDFNKHEREFTESFIEDGFYKEDAWKHCTALEVIDMVKDMLSVFEEIGNGLSLPASVLFSRLYDFIKEYTRPVFTKTIDEAGKEKWKKTDNSRDIGLGLLKDLRTAMAFDTKERDAKELLRYADEALKAISTSDPASSNAVTVRALNSWIPIDRKHVYIIGLSLNEMQVNSNQSPVISDEEMNKLLIGKKCYIPSSDNRIARQKLVLDQTLATFEDGTLTFGFSYWNAEKKSPINPHYFFVNAYETIKDSAYPAEDHEDPSKNPFIYFEYGNPAEDKTVKKADVKEKDTSVIDDFEKRNLSSSSLESLLSCPKSFAYSKIQCLPDNEYSKKEPAKWLDALRKGTFFHETLKKYSESDLRFATNKLTDDEKEKIRKFAEEVFEEEMKDIAPIEDYDVMRKEKESLIEKEIIPYIEDLREDMKENHWKIWKPEKSFEDLILSEDTYPDSKGNIRKVTMHIHSGSIDCIDYRLIDDGTNKKVELRIRDYKTGSHMHKQKSFKDGDLIQYKVYAEALKTKLLDEVKKDITKIESGKTEGWSFEFVCFRYDFPSDRDKTAKKIEIQSDKLDWNSKLRLRVILTAMFENNTYPDVLELKDYVADDTNGLAARTGAPELDALSDELKKKYDSHKKYKGPCKFCSYKDLCINRKSGDIKDA